MATAAPDNLAAVADRFRVLAEVARLRVLDALRNGPQHVTGLMAATGLQQANLSRHLQHLYQHGFVTRTRQGTFVHYAIADHQVFALCDIMCGQLARAPRPRQHAGTTRRLVPGAGVAAATRRRDAAGQC
jgi:DNA-binding transcriptional ArsR family regulator